MSWRKRSALHEGPQSASRRRNFTVGVAEMLQNLQHERLGSSIVDDAIEIDTDQIGAMQHEAYAVVIAEDICSDFSGS